MRSMRLGEISVIDRLDDSSGDFFHIATLQDPIAARGRKPLYWVKRHAWIAPWTASVVNAHRLGYLHRAGRCFCWRYRAFAKRNPHVRVHLTGTVYFVSSWPPIRGR